MKNSLDLRINLPPKKRSLDNKMSLREEALVRSFASKNALVVLSAHLDDAVLSMGSLIGDCVKKGLKVEVITIFTVGSDLSSPSTRELLKKAGFSEAAEYFRARRNEDTRALKLLGVSQVRHLGCIDSAWRSIANSRPLYPKTQLTSLRVEDKSTHKQVVMLLKTVVTNPELVAIFAPLAVGKHVDHQIVRNAASSLYPNVIFYTDFPYSNLYTNEHEFIKVNRLKPIQWKGDYDAKKKAILEYKTQRASFMEKGDMKLSWETYLVR